MRCSICKTKSRALKGSAKDEERVVGAVWSKAVRTPRAVEEQLRAFPQFVKSCGTEGYSNHQVHAGQSWATRRLGWHFSVVWWNEKNQEENSLQDQQPSPVTPADWQGKALGWASG